tara:strand:- start:25 stop:309 length:285 start_codon:yes stop_codon:yes gene_type:complete
MSKDKNWSDLTKKEKDNAKATAAAAGCLIFWHSLTKAGKWSVARWWIVYIIFYSYISELEISDWQLSQDLRPLFGFWIIFGCIVLYKFRNKFFK